MPLPTEGRVTLDVPPLVENGNTVPLIVSVESPMTAADHVKAIHVFNEKNPQPNVLSARLGPHSGKADRRHAHQAGRQPADRGHRRDQRWQILE